MQGWQFLEKFNNANILTSFACNFTINGSSKQELLDINQLL